MIAEEKFIKMKTKWLVGLTAFLMVIAVSCNNTKSTKSEKWVGTWACAPYAADKHMPPAPYLENNTLRQVVRVSIGGNQLQLKFSNRTCSTPVTMKSVNIAVSTGGSTIDSTSIKFLTFNGDSAVTMNPYSEITSDALDYVLEPNARIAITIHYGQVETSKDMTFHYGSRTDSYILPGDQSTSVLFSEATKVERWYHISAIDVKADESFASVAVIGNSITDAYGLHGGLKNKWTDIFSERLLKNETTKNIGVLNLGIGGTYVSGGSPTSGLSRYKEDLLAQSGVNWIVIFYGTNDIGGGVGDSTIINAYQTIIDDAHKNNIKVYGATITPFKGHGYYTEDHERIRKTVNEWIRTPGNFDACIDFDKAIQDPEDPERLAPEYSKDWLHPNTEGYAFLGKSVDLSLFVIE